MTIVINERLTKPQWIELFNRGHYVGCIWGTAKVIFEGHKPNSSRYMLDINNLGALIHADAIGRRHDGEA